MKGPFKLEGDCRSQRSITNGELHPMCQDSPYNSMPLHTKVEYLKNHGNCPEDERTLRAAPQLNNSHQESMCLLDSPRLQQKQTQIVASPSAVALMRKQAQLLLDGGQLADAATVFASLLIEDNHDVEALLGLGDLCLRSNQFAEGKTFFDGLLKLSPKHQEAQAGRDICRISADYERLHEYCVTHNTPDPMTKLSARFMKGEWKYYLSLNQMELLSLGGKTVVDFGCKYGHSFPFIVLSGAKHVTGIEGFEGYLIASKSVFEKMYRNVTVLASDAGYMPLQPDTADLVLMLEVISHVNPAFLETVFSEAYRILKRGGVLFIADGNNIANNACREALAPLYEAWENGPDGTKTDRDTVESSFLSCRKEIIRSRYPDIEPPILEYLALNTSGLFGNYLEKTIDKFMVTGELIRRPYRKGNCPTNPIGYGTVMERGFYPQKVAMDLKAHGFESHHILLKPFGTLSEYFRRLSLEEVSLPVSEIGAHTGFHLLAIKN
jgi:SAM-dependent methyltransferase